MDFPDDVLTEDEQCVLTTRPHVLQVAGSCVLLLLCAAALVGGAVAAWWVVANAASSSDRGFLWSMRLLTWSCVALPALLVAIPGVASIVRWRNTRYAVTNHRIIKRVGLLRKFHRDTPLHRVQDIHLDQGIVAQALKTGHLRIESAGAESAIELDWMPDVERARRVVHHLAGESRRRQREPELEDDL